MFSFACVDSNGWSEYHCQNLGSSTDPYPRPDVFIVGVVIVLPANVIF